LDLVIELNLQRVVLCRKQLLNVAEYALAFVQNCGHDAVFWVVQPLDVRTECKAQ
jgi:hypothetical protein